MRIIFLVLLQFGFFALQAQESQVDKLLKQGSALFNHELYEDAINKYKQAITFDKDNEAAHYELAYTYLTIKDWEDALYYCRLILDFEGEYWVDALLIYGRVLDNKGNSKQAIREYKKAIKKYPNESLLYYNLAHSYKLEDEFQKAEEAIIKCLTINKSHLPSHLFLSAMMKDQDKVLKGMLPLYYCLLLEPDNAKKQDLLSKLQVMWYVAQVQRKEAKKPISKHLSQSGLQVAESELYTLSRDTSNEFTEEPDKLIHQTQELFSMLNEVQSGELDFFDIMYVDFFTMLHRAGHTDAFSNYICSASYNVDVVLWITDNQSAFRQFMDWMELQQ